MKTIMIMHLFTSSMFILMKHPLSMGFILLLQTTLSCLMNSMNTKSTWFSMILFITFVGGMMIMFIYMASIASNEKFKLSKKMILYSPMMIIAMLILSKKEKLDMIMEETLIKNMKIYNKEIMSLMKTFNYPTMMITLLMILYLLITMIIVVKITNIKEGPLRIMN